MTKLPISIITHTKCCCRQLKWFVRALSWISLTHLQLLLKLNSKYLPVVVDISQWKPLPECQYFSEIIPLKTSVFYVCFLFIILLEGQSALTRTQIISGKNRIIELENQRMV